MKKKLIYLLFCLLGAVQAYNSSAQPAIFSQISVSPYGVPSDQISTINLQAEHYGRPIVNIPCTYQFYVVDLATNQTVPENQGCNMQTITLPSNQGRLNMNFNVFLPPGHYYIQYNYLGSFTEGPFSFSDFWVFDSSIAAISSFSIKTAGQSNVQGTIDNEAGTITINLPYYHTNLSNATAEFQVSNGGKISINGNPVTGTSFTADFTQPVSVRVTSLNGTVTKDYTINVTNGDGSKASIESIEIHSNQASFSESGVIDQENGTITFNLTKYYKDLNNMYGYCVLAAGAKLEVNGSPTNGSYFIADFTGPVIISVISPDGNTKKDYTVTVTNGPGGNEVNLKSFKISYRKYNGVSSEYIDGKINEEEGKIVFKINDKVFSELYIYYDGVICTNFGTTISVTNGPYYSGYSYDNDCYSFSYSSAYSSYIPNTLSITSPDGTVVKNYSIIFEGIWYDIQYCSGFFDRYGPLAPLTETIPLAWLSQGRIYANIVPLYNLLMGQTFEHGEIHLAVDNFGGFVPIYFIMMPGGKLEPNIYLQNIGYTPGSYNVILKLYPFSGPLQQYVLGRITLTDKTPPLSDDATLSWLNVYISTTQQSFPLSPSFSPEITDYTTLVPNEVENITISATNSNSRATVVGYGLKTLAVGKNIFEITVTAENGNKKVYTVTIYRSAPTAGALIIAPNQTITLSQQDYNALQYTDIIFKTDANDNTGQLLITGETLTVNGVVKLQKSITKHENGNKKWYAVGFPFELATIYSEYHNLNLNAWDGSGGDFWLMTYNGSAFVYVTAMEAGKGYAIQFPNALAGKEVTFISVNNPTLYNASGFTNLASNTYEMRANPSVANTELTAVTGNQQYYLFDGNLTFMKKGETAKTLKPFESLIVIESGGTVLRSISVENNLTGLNDLDIGKDKIVETHYYNLQGVEVLKPVGNNIYIVKTVYESKKVKVSKVLYPSNYNKVNVNK